MYHGSESSSGVSFSESPTPIPPHKNKPKRKPDGYDQPHHSFGKKPNLDLMTTCEAMPSPPASGREIYFCFPSPSSVSSNPPSLAVQDWLENFQALSRTDKTDALTFLVENCNIAEIRHLRTTIEPYFQKDFISLLPKECALLVLKKLDAKDLARASETCRYWRTLTEDHVLWRQKSSEKSLTSFSDLPASVHKPDSCYSRSPWKALYLRHCRINANWRKSGCPLENMQYMRGHDEHVITGLEVCGDKIISASDDHTLKVWSASTGQCLHTLSSHSGGVWSSQLSEDGKYVVSGATDRSVKVWDADTGLCLHTLQGHTSTVRCMALKNRVLVTGSRDTTLRVWDIETGENLHVLSGHVAAVRCVQFDGKTAVSGAYDYTVKVWDVETEKCLHTLAGHTNRVYSLQLDSERNLVISGSLDTSIRVWDIRTGQCLHTLVGHQSLTSGMQLRGNVLVSGNADSTVKVWNIVDGQCLFTLAGPNKHNSAVTSIQFLANGLVVTSSDDGTVKLWDAVQGSFIRDLVRLESGGKGGCIWRLRATPTSLVCAVGSRNGTEDTKLILLDFNADFP